jgi:hypothetical protein
MARENFQFGFAFTRQEDGSIVDYQEAQRFVQVKIEQRAQTWDNVTQARNSTARLLRIESCGDSFLQHVREAKQTQLNRFMCLESEEKWEVLGNYYSLDFRYLSLKVNKCH